MAKAPQTLFAALHVDQAEIAELENKVVAAYPNISTINLVETAAELGLVMAKLVGIVNVFAGFSILADVDNCQLGAGNQTRPDAGSRLL